VIDTASQTQPCGCIVSNPHPGHTHTKLCPEHFVLPFEDRRKLHAQRAVEQLKQTTNGDLI
jgi:hypothetical protein